MERECVRRHCVDSENAGQSAQCPTGEVLRCAEYEMV